MLRFSYANKCDVYLHLADSTDTLAESEASGDGMPLSTPALGSFPTWSTSPSNTEDVQSAITPTIVPETGSADGNEPGTSDIVDLHPALIFGVPAVLLIILLILLVFLIVRCRKKKQSKQGDAHELDLGVPDSAHPSPLLQASHELGSETCKSPIFEEDTPSVMEIEMEELDKWMNSLKRNAECEYLPPVKEEKDGNANPRYLQFSSYAFERDSHQLQKIQNGTSDLSAYPNII
ncbi:hypothetical protein lerEdw1_012190 [Lerista edwardsae]|nr:hypothetical protein lerEdw1_012190 [Lerista edwardsae]